MDDMGNAQASNEAIERCFREGIGRSAEVMMPAQWAPDAVRIIAATPGLDVGVHLCVTSEWDRSKWRPLTPVKSFVDADGFLVPQHAQPKSTRLPLGFVGGNDHFFLNLSMAACKAMLRAAEGVPNATMVTTMARNGVSFGIRVSGAGDRWFEAPAQVVEGLFFPGYGPADAAADLGDSAITETAGLGGFAMAAAPAIAQFVGGRPADAVGHSRRMQRLAIARNPAFTLPPLDFAPTVAGIDVRLVLDGGPLPVINTGIAHREAGVGQIGAGITTAPLGCFLAAFDHLFPSSTGHASG